MKKTSKIVFAALSAAAFAGGIYYFVKNILNKDSDDDFDDFDDDFDDFDVEEDKDETNTDERGYVTLNIPENASSDETEQAEEEMKENAPEECVQENDSESAAPQTSTTDETADVSLSVKEPEESI